MEQIYNRKMQELGYDKLVCDIFDSWEGVKDELLVPNRKTGSGNGTIHVFLGGADVELRKEFASYYNYVKTEEDAAKKAVEVKHYFLYSNIISMLGHVCKYNFSQNKEIEQEAIEILTDLASYPLEYGMLSTKSLFKLSTGSNKLRPYFKQFDNNGVFSRIIRKILIPNSSYKISLYKNSDNEYAAFWLIGIDNISTFEADSNIKNINRGFEELNKSIPLQQITYGAPGTGKSFGIDEDLERYHMTAIRTTFHPDSDYSTFVGAYKPQMEIVGQVKTQAILDYSTLVDKFKEYLDAKPTNITKACTMFGFDYHDSIVNMQNYGKTIVDLVSDAYKSGTPYDSQVRAGMSVYEQNAPADTREKKIVYKFSRQAFLKAYIAAWKDLKNPYVLVIEEINRGNCAQVFGDLFQLLDRNDKGYSSYPITPDADIVQTLNEAFDALHIPESDAIDSLYTENVMSDVLAGTKMLLPNNLYIWATMNTSDQSLFPIDSAFKRRWEWKYVPISDAGKRWTVLVNGVRYDWWSFLDNINKKIWDATHSEDKKLGYFFCKANPDDGIISADKFVGKVLFYIYNDVFKDYGFDDAIFKDEIDKENPELLFKDFFLPNGKPREDKIQIFMKNLKVNTEAEQSAQIPNQYAVQEEETEGAESTSAQEPQNPNFSTTKYAFNGNDDLSEVELAIKIIDNYLAENSVLSFEQLKSVLSDDLIGESWKLYGLLATLKDLKTATYEEQKKIYKIFDKTAKHISADGVEFYINTNWCPANIQAIINFAKERGWNVSVEN